MCAFPTWGVLSIEKVPGDVPPARVYFFRLLIYPKIYFLAISSQGPSIISPHLSHGHLFLPFVLKKKCYFGGWSRGGGTLVLFVVQGTYHFLGVLFSNCYGIMGIIFTICRLFAELWVSISGDF